ncbi:MAG: ABC transporter ATP-binding protein [Actinobacteria bacterium]|nr:ABC transporter ATP-binding protein [Actinomycetota bacterium]
MIGLRGLEVAAGDFSVGPLDLEVAAGEYAVLLGPSGAGKTLVLEALAGVRRIRAGRLLVDGADVTELPAERRRVGLVFQDGLLFPHLSVADNVAYSLHRSNGDGERAGWRRRPSADRLAQLAGQVGITHLLKRRPQTLSGGESQRVALARALAARPRALLLDEPLSAVDDDARDGLQDLLRRLSADEGLTVVHVTHDLEEAFAVGSLFAVMVAGRLQQVGAPYDVLRRPATVEVARFTGARNVFEARSVPGDSRHLALALGGTLRISSPAPAGVCHAVVRAEDITVLPEQHSRVGEGDSFFTGRVRRVVCAGATAVVEVDVPPLFRAAISARELEAFAIGPGSKVGLRVPAAAVHVV